MSARLSADERLRRAVAAYLKHLHKTAWRCPYCQGFTDRMAAALQVAHEEARGE